jgi:hypothetical protein
MLRVGGLGLGGADGSVSVENRDKQGQKQVLRLRRRMTSFDVVAENH